MGWPAAAWRTDPGLLDAGLQLALLWARQAFGHPSLPTAVERLVLHRPGPLSGTARCLLRSRRVGSLQTVSDVVFTGEHGALVAELRGLTMHLHEGGA
jgi:hypothetical protein